MSRGWKHIVRRTGADLRTTAGYSSQTSGRTERKIQIIKEALRCDIDKAGKQ